MVNQEKKSYGMIAEFKTVSGVYKAAQRVREAGYKNWDVLSPFPIHGIDKAMGIKRSKVPVFTLFAGMTGTTIAVLMVWFMNAYDYPLIVGGKPYFSPIFPFPVFFELTILFAAFGTLFGMFITNRLPRHNHPIFNHPGFHRATDDHFWIVIETEDPSFNLLNTESLLKEIGGQDIHLLEK